MRIGILTGGGDVPGLNPCIKAVVLGAQENGWEVLGIRRGWAGLLNYNPQKDGPENREWVSPADAQSVRTIDRMGGTYLHTSRTNPQKVRAKELPRFLEGTYRFGDGQKSVDCTAHVLDVLKRLRIDVLVPIGGDDTLSYAVRLHQEGVRIVAIPKTMDNDVFGTDYCIGFSTAVSRTVEFVHALRTPAGSHERIAVVEVFGRNSGETSLVSAHLSAADRALISEVPADIQRLTRLLAEDRQSNPSRYAVVIVSEGASLTGEGVVERGQEDAYGHKKLGGIGQQVGEAITRISGIDCLVQQLAYLMRAGPPDALDRMVATSYGRLAVEEIRGGQFGRMVSLQKGLYTTVPVDTCTQGLKRVDVDQFYDTDQYRPRIRGLVGKPMFLY
jgi:6-phosphofructokinase